MPDRRQIRRHSDMRRATVASILLAGSMLLPAGAASAAPGFPQPAYPAMSKQVTINWWSWTANAKNVIAAFEKQYPNIHVVQANLGGSLEITKLVTVLKAGSGAPDVVQVPFYNLPQIEAT